MKSKSIILATVLYLAFLTGCSAGPAERLVYQESQFKSRLAYLRFCQHYAMATDRCE
jgi:hypothetical protein